MPRVVRTGPPPLVVRGPGFEGGNRVKSPVSLVDLPPTLLDAAGIEPPAAMEGNSAMELVEIEQGDSGAGGNQKQSDAFVQISEAEVGRALRTERWKYAVYDPDADGWNESASDRYVERYLYDFDADPYERVNLVGRADYREEAEQLRERLVVRIASIEGKTPKIEPAAHHP